MQAVQFIYQNYKGKIELRTVIPEALEFLSCPGFSYQPGWFLTGWDCEREARRSFSLNHMVLEGGRLVLVLGDS